MDGVERRRFNHFTVGAKHFVNGEVSQHGLSDILSTLGPDVDDLIVALTVGNETFSILLLDFGNLFHRGAHKSILGFRNHHIIETDGDTGDGRIAVTGFFKTVSKQHRLFIPSQTEADVDQVSHLLLGHHLVDLVKRNDLMHHIP